MKRTTLITSTIVGLSSVLTAPASSDATELLQWADHTNASTEYYDSSLCAYYSCAEEGIKGAPNGKACGTTGFDPGVWMPVSSGNHRNWVKARFDVPVFAAGIEIVQRGVRSLRARASAPAGFIKKVEVLDIFGKVVATWEGTDPSNTCPATFVFNFSETTTLVKSVYIETQVQGYEQIDAVKLIGTDVEGSPLDQWASDASGSAADGQYWTAANAEGPPLGSAACGDQYYHWVPKWNGSDPEYLEAFFDVAVYANRVRVYEGWNVGFVFKVEVIYLDGTSQTVWEGTDPTTACPGVFEVTFPAVRREVNGVRIHTQIHGYEEIDAVQLGGIVPQDFRMGTVSAATGTIRDTLFINRSNGGSARQVDVEAGDPIRVFMQRPAESNGRFFVHAFADTGRYQPTPLPLNIGTGSYPMLTSQGLNALATWNALFASSEIGVSFYFDRDLILDPSQAPTAFLDLPMGDLVNLPSGTKIIFQGVVHDPYSASVKPYSATNAVTLNVK